MSSESGELPVRVCYLGCEPVFLYSNQSIGTFEEASAIEEDPELQAFVRKEQDFNIAPELSVADKERLEQLLLSGSPIQCRRTSSTLEPQPTYVIKFSLWRARSRCDSGPGECRFT